MSGGTGNRSTGTPAPAPVWWSDALNDPWRNPDSAAVIVSRAPPPAPVPEVVPPPPRGVGLIIAVATVVALLAGALGGAIGYVAATGRQASHVVLGGGPRSPAPPALREPGSLPALVTRVLPSVVTVTVTGRGWRGESIGSGFVISADGYLITNEHVIADVPDRMVRVTLADATTLPARVVGRDPESDLAVLKVDRTDLRAVEFADSDAVAVGDGVVAIGTQLALSGTVTLGIVSAVDRTIETRGAGGEQRYYAAIQTDAAVNRGSSGGPLFDLSGRVVGVNSVIKSLVEDGEDVGNIGIAFAIPINQAVRVASEIIDTGRARRTVIGARVDRDSDPGGGVRLTTVDVGGPAASGGLRSGDVVLRLGNHLIVAPHDLIALVRRYDPGTTVTVVYRRGVATATANVTLVADAN